MDTKNIEVKIKNSIYKKEELKEKPHYILWSGGFDSTYLAFQFLQMYKDREIYGDIILLSQESPYLNPKKAKKEKECRDKMMKIWKEEYGYIFKHIEITTLIEIDSIFPSIDRFGYWQQFLFITQAYPYVRNDSVIILGYVNDDNNMYMNDIHNIIKSIDNLTNGVTTIVTPIIDSYKHDIVKNIIDIDINLLDSIWVCEAPVKNEKGVIKPCYSCDKCKEIYESLLYIKHIGNINNTNKLINSIKKDIDKKENILLKEKEAVNE